MYLDLNEYGSKWEIIEEKVEDYKLDYIYNYLRIYLN